LEAGLLRGWSALIIGASAAAALLVGLAPEAADRTALPTHNGSSWADEKGAQVKCDDPVRPD